MINMSAVGEALVAAHFEVLLGKLASPTIKESSSKWDNAEKDLADLRTALRRIKGVLTDAEQQQTKNKEVKDWLDELSHLAYDAEDILDEYATYGGQLNVTTNKVRSSIPSSELRSIKARMEYINKRVKELENGIIEFDLKRVDIESRKIMVKQITERRQTSSLVDKSNVYGRETDKSNKIIERLMVTNKSNEKNFEVACIVGIGGLGKTTLAQLVYNDEEVEGHFDLKAWFCVSEESDVAKITKGIIESATGELCGLTHLDTFQVKLKKTLEGKRFLIVLDDVWSDNCGDWKALRLPFMYGENGSKSIVTTRSKKVSNIMGTIPTFFLGSLPDEDCLSLLWQCACVDNIHLNAHPELKAIARKIVESVKVCLSKVTWWPLTLST
ncbi:PREDICTED: putative disease resistance RPP13-like protein 1 [Nelumbo nucifera]|uniref:Disease resistance RPP13-like protein 1 n=2 Tax=Nelumbo nucifera TaxID=4432 RepID=A0A1U8AEZ8_NELNU|nr:PREDICTED: putative disease resistance RPP13-like protein 1 [Nelumbo nucifera]DAD27415.1 TPA_asm: hypothetical protein HUJ06_028883 [Nelumbo nucifera]